MSIHNPTEQPVPLVRIYREGVLENVHDGHVVVVNVDGEVIWSAGNPNRVTPARSCLKPFQALPVVLDGLDSSRGLTSMELAIMSGSHAAHPVHTQAVSSLLKKAYLSVDHLQCGQPRSASSRLENPCSGKHAGMLLYTQAKGADTARYLDRESPVQQRIYTELLRLTRAIRSEMPIVTDGCGAPVACMPLSKLAMLYGQLSHPPAAGEQFGGALTRILSAIRIHPECLEGDDLFDTEVCRLSGKETIVKAGAGGIGCAALTAPRLGVAVKLESGNLELLRGVMATVLGRLTALPATVVESLRQKYVRPPKTVSGQICGRVEFILPE